MTYLDLDSLAFLVLTDSGSLPKITLSDASKLALTLQFSLVYRSVGYMC